MILQMTIIGTIVFYKMPSMIRAKFVPRVDLFQTINNVLSDKAIKEIEKLILNVVRK
jgi:hypothetical protein